jgi:L-lactate dehydrogenase (cytochrome)
MQPAIPTKSYSEIHAPSLRESKVLEALDPLHNQPILAKPSPTVTTSFNPNTKPPLEPLIKPHNFISGARQILTPKT